ncbi:MAG: MFS family permease [Alphaproteobacteria bacterium]|jgi:MFS family permease
MHDNDNEADDGAVARGVNDQERHQNQENNASTPQGPGRGDQITGRIAIGIYGTAFFSLSMVPMSSILVPLWMVSLGATPLMIGLAIGVRSLLPLLLSIHGGVLMDRLGPRRVTLAVAVMAAALFPLYPLMPWFIAIIFLQALFGIAQGLCWVGSQTFYGQYMRGHVAGAGRLVLFSNGGCFVGPLVLGAITEHVGTHAGFGFMCIWAMLMVGFTLLVPDAQENRQIPNSGSDLSQTTGWRGFLPRLADYRSALALCVLPVVMMVMIFTFIRIANASVQTSFYVVYLGQIHLGETLIGALLGIANLVATVTPPLIQAVERRVPALWVLILATAATIVFMAMTPVLGAVWLLFCASAAYGAGVGLGFPTLLALLSRSIPLAEQGKSVGLRTSFNRLASLIIPIAMGAIAEAFGIRISFFVVGGVLLLATAATAVWVLRHPGLAR